MPAGKNPRFDFDAVRDMVAGLGEFKETTSYGGRSIRVQGKMMVFTPTNKAAEPGSLGVRIAPEVRAELVAHAPDIYYVPDHYVNYPTVLVRMDRIGADALKDLLAMAWKFVTAKPAPARKRAHQ